MAITPHVETALRRVLAQLEAELPDVLDEIEAEDADPEDTGTTWGGLLGELEDPKKYGRLVEGMAEVDWPAVLIEVEGTPDEEDWVSRHRSTHIPIAVHVVGRWGDDENADSRSWLYSRAVDTVLLRHVPVGPWLPWVEVETPEMRVWGEDAWGRAAICRATLHMRTTRAAA